MSDIIVVLAICAIGAIVIALLHKASSLIKTIILVAIILIGLAGYVIFVPTSPLSMSITENIVSTISLDAENKYSNGDIIYSFELGEADNSVEEDIAQSLTDGLNDWLLSRVRDMVSKHIELNEHYVLEFKDSYLEILLTTPNTVQIVKGKFEPIIAEVDTDAT